MTDRLAIHVLTAFPPSNPNRDETGQPKTAVVGGKTRQRISSQCIKRTWRLSQPITELDVPLSVRTRGLGSEIARTLKAAGMPEKAAVERATKIAGAFGKVDKKRAPDHAEMVVYGREEWEAAHSLAATIAKAMRDPTDDEVAALPRATRSLDCVLFGRMRAADPGLNVDAAVSVSHSLTVNQASIENDFWTSVDDLKEQDDEADQGSGGMGDVEYGSGVYYTYVDVNMPLLIGNLGGDKSLAAKAIQALLRAITTTTPKGHRTTFGNPVRAGYLRVELGDPSGNLFCSAFESPLVGMKPAIEALRAAAERESRAYDLRQTVAEMSVPEGRGSLADVIQTVGSALGA